MSRKKPMPRLGVEDASRVLEHLQAALAALPADAEPDLRRVAARLAQHLKQAEEESPSTLQCAGARADQASRIQRQHKGNTR
jgi:truncated hemoglobin YjbI